MMQIPVFLPVNWLIGYMCYVLKLNKFIVYPVCTPVGAPVDMKGASFEKFYKLVVVETYLVMLVKFKLFSRLDTWKTQVTTYM